MISINMNVDKFLINDLYKFHSEYYEKFLQIEKLPNANIGLLKTLSFCEHGKICWMLLLQCQWISLLQDSKNTSFIAASYNKKGNWEPIVTSQKVINYTAFPSTRFFLFPHWFPFEKDFIQQFFKPTFVVLTPWFWWRIF